VTSKPEIVVTVFLKLPEGRSQAAPITARIFNNYIGI
jgi:cell division protein FtsI/penicillin-binding protein 2